MMINWEMLGVLLSVLVNMGVGVWWASKITAKLDSNRDALTRLEKDIEKRDAQLAAAWKKIDNINERLTVVETKCKINHHGEE